MQVGDGLAEVIYSWFCPPHMPPQALRKPTRKAAEALPDNAKFAFLTEAARCSAGVSLQLSSHLGRAALKVGGCLGERLPGCAGPCTHTAHIMIMRPQPEGQIRLTDSASYSATNASQPASQPASPPPSLLLPAPPCFSRWRASLRQLSPIAARRCCAHAVVCTSTPSPAAGGWAGHADVWIMHAGFWACVWIMHGLLLPLPRHSGV